MEPGFERLYAIRDWYDGPRDGAADYRGRPHRFRSLYLDNEEWDADDDRFELTPLPEDILLWMVEAYELWQPGVLPEDRQHYEILEAQVDAALANLKPIGVARGEFSLTEPAVRWRPVE